MKLPVGAFLVSGWSIDTRTLAAGDLFIALRGPNHDGHAFVAQAFANGAVAALVERPVDGPHVVVPDTQAALEDLGRRARREWGGKLAAVTGSAGKTSTKDMIAAVLAAGGMVNKTSGNLNNHIGVPLSLLRFDAAAPIGVLEVGMNHSGEIRHLCSIASPNVGVVTNVGWAHIENFESQEGIALAKRELIDSLPPDGCAVLNYDDARVRSFAKSSPCRFVMYGIDPKADVAASAVELREDSSSFEALGTRFDLPIAGRHAISNALAAIATGVEFGITAAQARDALASLAPGKMRGERIRHNGALLLNDSYNSNPDAARAMIDVLRDSSATRRVAVLGEMLELGRWTETLHGDVGNYAAAQGVNVLVGIRGAARLMVAAARKAGMPESAALFFEDPVEAGEYVRSIVAPGDAVLFKGSRGTRVEKALERVLA